MVVFSKQNTGVFPEGGDSIARPGNAVKWRKSEENTEGTQGDFLKTVADPACTVGAASAVVSDTRGVLILAGLNLLLLVLNSGEILDLSEGEKMPMAAFVTRLRPRQRERDVKNELMSVVNNNKTAASRRSFASFSFRRFQLNIPIKP